MISTIPILEEAQQILFSVVIAVSRSAPMSCDISQSAANHYYVGIVTCAGIIVAVLTTPQISLRLNFVERHLNTTTIRS
jgi:hypothetical protein